MNERELNNRTVLVTGGSRGIGRECCLRLAEAGAKVAVNYRAGAEAARHVVEQIRAGGGTAISCPGDVSQPAQVDAMIAQVRSELGPIELLVNNAGVFEFTTHDRASFETWKTMLDINLTGCYLTTWAVKDEMIERGFGRIVNVSSIAGLVARPMSIAYSVSKAGVVALTRSLAAAVAEHNVRVNAVAPGLVDTEILSGVDHDSLNALIASTPMKRIGNAKEIAELVLFLLSERSSFTTGQTIVASGGRVMLP
ncbi:MAG: SDR family NAD(P)-dependent oxidoreductase [Planctomycetaceae bacterium]